MTSTTVTFTFYLRGGQTLKFALPTPNSDIDPIAAVANVRKGLEAQQFAIEVDGKLIVIPGTAVSYVEISPAPEMMPSVGVLRGATAIH